MNSRRELPVIPGQVHGRGAIGNPANRFLPLSVEIEPETLAGEPAPRTQFFRDTTRSLIARNNSPDVGFSFSINPYRGCEHGCIYCYARPTHEYFGLSAGLDFETRIFVKEDAPELLREELSSRRWRPATIAISGVTDCYQPVERRLEITRRCLQILAEFRNPCGIISKNALVTRDIDILSEMAADDTAAVNVSVTTLDPELQRRMEPRTSAPAKRLEAIAKLAEAGIPVGVMVAPVIPGLTDHEMPGILKAVAEAGARSAGFVLLRLPYAVAPLFEEWVHAHFPERAPRVLGRIRDTRSGRLNDPRFESRMRGEGEYAAQIESLFRVSCEKFGLNKERRSLSTAAWRGPSVVARTRDQLPLF